MKLKHIATLFVLALASGILLGACGATTPSPTPVPTPTPILQPISVTDGLSRTITLDQAAQRVVSLAPSNTEILFAVGAGKQVVGRDMFSDYPAEAASLPIVGGDMGKYDSEAILSLKPDLVLASELTPAELVKSLEDLGLTVYYLPNPKDLDGMYANLLAVAEMTGHTAETEKLVKSLQDRVAVVTEKMTGVKERPLVFYELDATDPNAPYTSGPGTFVDTLLSMSGAKNLGSTLGSPWAQVSLEELVVQNPQIILLGDSVWGAITPEVVAQRAGWEGLAAVLNNHVFPFDDNLVSRPGPRMVDGLEQMAKLIHPELFK